MSDDLVKRLRDPGVGSARWVLVERPLLVATADLIEAQAARIAELESRITELKALAYGLMIAMSASGDAFSDILKEARAALEGGKDDRYNQRLA